MMCRISIFALLAAAMTLAAQEVNITVNANNDSHIGTAKVTAGSQSMTLAKNGTATWTGWGADTTYTPEFTNVDVGYTAKWEVTKSGQSTKSGGAGNTITLSQSYSECTLRFYGEPNTYTVTFDRQSGSGGSSSVTATYDAAMPAITVPTRTGYTFDGYYTSADGGGTQYYTAAGASARNWDKTSATTLYAKWTANTYTVTLDQQSGSGGSSSVTATYGSAMPAITKPSRTGYTFGGYYTSANGGGTQYYKASGASAKNWDKTSATTLYAKWTANTYTVTFDQQSGSGGTASVTVTYDAALPTITPPKRTGYTFAGYYKNSDGTGTKFYNADGTGTRNWDREKPMTLYAKWTVGTYKVTFDQQSGSGGTASVTVTYGAALPTITPPTRTGYTFAGYYKNSDGTGTKFYNADGTGTMNWDREKSMTLYAKWTANTYTVTLDRQSGSGGTASVTVTYGAALPTITPPTRTGYTFAGYYKNADGSGTKFYNADGTGTQNWDRDRNLPLYAKWIQNPIVTFVLNGGTFRNGWMTPTNYVEGVGMNLPTAADITYTNRAFIGWYEDEMCLGDRVTRIRPDDQGDRTFYARWEGRSYKVSFDVNGGKGRDQQEQTLFMTNSERLKFLAELYVTPQDGYTFAEWNTAVDGSGDSYPDGAVIENNLTNVANATVTLYAQWTPNPYEVAFNPNGADGGETMTNQWFTYDVAQPLNAVEFTYTGHAFKNWSRDTNYNYSTKYYLDGAVVTNLATGGVVNLYANWTGIVYTVSFDANEGTGSMDPLTCTYNVWTNLPHCTFTRDGWGFSGWMTNVNDEVLFADGARVTNLTTRAEEMTLYACWTGATYSVVLDASADTRGKGVMTNGLSVLTNFYVVGEAWDLPSPTNVEAHLSFSGWTYVDTNGVTVTVAESDVVPPPSVFGGATNLVAAWTWGADPLAVAVDAPEMSFATRGTVGIQGRYKDESYPAAEWFVQTNYVHDSTNAVQNGDLLERGDANRTPPRLIYASWLTTTVPTNGVLTFWWKCEAPDREERTYGGDVSAVGYSFHFGKLEDDGGFKELTTEVDGDSDWARVVYTNNVSGPVTFAWQFRFTDPTGDATIGGRGWVDRVTWTPEGSSAAGDVTPTHGVAHAWLRTTFPEHASDTDADLETLAESQSPGEGLPPGKTWSNGTPVMVWQDYWAGTNPYDPNDLFRANIAVTNDVPYISWQPDLSVTGDPVRVYQVLCAPTPSAQEWVEWPDGSGASTNRFFKVKLILEEE